MRLRWFLTGVSALLSILTLGVSAGVAWLVATLYFRLPPEVLAPIVGLLLAWALRATTRAPGLTCAAVAVLSTLLAALCVSVVLTGLGLAGAMGLSLRQALGGAGPGMLWALVRMGLPASALAWYGVAVILAVAVAFPPLRRKGRKGDVAN
mgnify:CR=1 FL=1